jgi:hypothetical protein
MFPFEQLLRLASACDQGAMLFLESAYFNLPATRKFQFWHSITVTLSWET